MTQKNRLLIIALITLLISAGVYVTYNQLLSGALNRDIEVYAKEDQFVNGVDYYTKQISQGNKIVICKQDWFKPIVVNIYKDDSRVVAGFTNLNRNSIFEQKYTVINSNDGESTEIYNLPFDEVVKLFKQKGCDFFKRNIDTPDNVEINGYKPVIMTYYPPITKEQRIADEAKKKEKQNFDDQFKAQQIEFEKLSVTEKVLKFEKISLQIKYRLAETDLSSFDNKTIQTSKIDIITYDKLIVDWKKDPGFDLIVFNKNIEQYLIENPQCNKYYIR